MQIFIVNSLSFYFLFLDRFLIVLKIDVLADLKMDLMKTEIEILPKNRQESKVKDSFLPAYLRLGKKRHLARFAFRGDDGSGPAQRAGRQPRQDRKVATVTVRFLCGSQPGALFFTWQYPG